MSRGTLQRDMKRTQRTPKLRSTICGSQKGFSYVGFKPTTHDEVGSGMAATLTTRPTELKYSLENIYLQPATP